MGRFRLIFKKRYQPLSRSKGSALLEVLVAVFIFMLLLGMISLILATGRNAWYIEDVSVELQQELRKAMTVMVKDLRQTSSSTIVGVPSNGSWSNTIYFRKPTGITYGYVDWGPQNQFLLLGTSTTGMQLLRAVGGTTTEVIANNINSLQLRRQFATRDIIEVVLGAQKTTTKGTQITDSLSFQVKMRN